MTPTALSRRRHGRRDPLRRRRVLARRDPGRAQSDKGVCAILLGDDPDALVRDLQDRFPKAKLIGGDAEFERLVAQVVGFVEAPAIGLDLPLDVRGTAFQQRVWQALREIPAGKTASYAEIAGASARPRRCAPWRRPARANPIAVAIPCHRVVRNDGALSGYRWGVERKRALLEQGGRGMNAPSQGRSRSADRSIGRGRIGRLRLAGAVDASSTPTAARSSKSC